MAKEAKMYQWVQQVQAPVPVELGPSYGSLSFQVMVSETGRQEPVQYYGCRCMQFGSLYARMYEPRPATMVNVPPFGLVGVAKHGLNWSVQLDISGLTRAVIAVLRVDGVDVGTMRFIGENESPDTGFVVLPLNHPYIEGSASIRGWLQERRDRQGRVVYGPDHLPVMDIKTFLWGDEKDSVAAQVAAETGQSALDMRRVDLAFYSAEIHDGAPIDCYVLPKDGGGYDGMYENTRAYGVKGGDTLLGGSRSSAGTAMGEEVKINFGRVRYLRGQKLGAVVWQYNFIEAMPPQVQELFSTTHLGRQFVPIG